jgi:hypothetical protein
MFNKITQLWITLENILSYCFKPFNSADVFLSLNHAWNDGKNHVIWTISEAKHAVRESVTTYNHLEVASIHYIRCQKSSGSSCSHIVLNLLWMTLGLETITFLLGGTTFPSRDHQHEKREKRDSRSERERQGERETGETETPKQRRHNKDCVPSVFRCRAEGQQSAGVLRD